MERIDEEIKYYLITSESWLVLRFQYIIYVVIAINMLCDKLSKNQAATFFPLEQEKNATENSFFLMSSC